MHTISVSLILIANTSFQSNSNCVLTLDDWKTLVGNLPKLGLSIASILYDIIFLLQEFVFYPDSNNSVKSSKDINGTNNLSRRSTLKKEAGDSRDQLCSVNSSISSLDQSSISSSTTTRSSGDKPPGFIAKQPRQQQQQQSSGTGVEERIEGVEQKDTKQHTIGGHVTTIDLSSQLDAIMLRRKSSSNNDNAQ